jgi:hypothetical protein
MDQHLADDVVWHVGGNSKWAGALPGQGRQDAGVLRPPGPGDRWATSVDIHDILGDNDHVVVLGTASATAWDGSSAEWRYTQDLPHPRWQGDRGLGMAENDAAVDPFLDGLPD